MNKLKYILRGIIVSIIITLILLLIFSWLLVETNIKEQYINTIIIVISSISILIGASISTIKLNKSGIANGLTISVLYMVILYIISSICNQQFSINVNTIYMFLCGIVLGILGGIIGVNIKS